MGDRWMKSKNTISAKATTGPKDPLTLDSSQVIDAERLPPPRTPPLAEMISLLMKFALSPPLTLTEADPLTSSPFAQVGGAPQGSNSLLPEMLPLRLAPT